MPDRDDVAYLVGPDAELIEMRPELFASEDELQELVATHPKLLAGAQMTPEDPRRWLLVTREMGVPVEEDGSDRFSVDHLFVDQDAVPTIVEVKRSTDTRTRRYVVGQMLDYAANGVRYWPAARLRDLYEQQCGDDDREPLDHLHEVVSPEAGPEEFWEAVADNLKIGRIRMVFVADRVPPELRSVVEFLNAGMARAEVYAVELPQFRADDGLRTLVPRLVGGPAQTERAERSRSYPPLDEVIANAAEHVRFVGERLKEWARRHGVERRESRTRIMYGPQGFELAYFVPGDELVWVFLNYLRDAELQDQANAHHAAFQALTPSKNLSKVALGLPAGDLTERWTAVESALDGYLAATLAIFDDDPGHPLALREKD